MTFLKRLLRSQTGAMFGMDARVALIIASVLAATGGITIMSKLERNRVDAAETGIELIRDGIITYYKMNSETVWNTFGTLSSADKLTTLINSGALSKSLPGTDPWGQNWQISVFFDSTNAAGNRIENIPVRLSYLIVFSNGKDAVKDAGTVATLTSAADYVSWVASGDDIGLKFSSLEIEKERVIRYREQGQAVISKLNAFEAGKFLEADQACSSATPPAHCATIPIFTDYNYYPESDGNAGGDTATYYTTDIESSQPAAYGSGTLAEMQALMTLIGLPTEFAADPWGRVLQYDSNVGDRSTPPFTASICFEVGCL